MQNISKIKKTSFILFFVFLFFINNIFSEKKTRVAVLNFSAKGVEKDLAEAVGENLITSLIDSGIFEVIERSQLNKLMSELSLQNSDDFNDELRKNLGELYGVELVILGSVTKIGNCITINTRGVEVETGIAKFAKNLTTDSENDIPYLIPLLVDIISGKKIDVDALGDGNYKASNDKDVLISSNIPAGKRILLGKKDAKTKWSSKKLYTDNLDDAHFSQILIEVKGNVVEFARVKIYCNNDYEITESENFFLGKNNKWIKSFKTINSKGNPRIIEKISIMYTVRSNDDDALAEVKVYGIR